MTSSIVLFGCGRMGSALASGWLKAEPKPNIHVQDPVPSALTQGWAEKGLIKLNGDAASADVLIIAVKPQVFPSVADRLKAFIGPDTLVLSIMAGITLAGIEAALGTQKIARAMPNTPGAVGQGVTLISVHESLGDADLKVIENLLVPVGIVEGPMTERDLQVAMTVSGCGPAYAYLLVEAMAAAGVASGLDPDLSMRIARQTVIGAGAMMAAYDDTAEALRVGVTSPGGVTAAALTVLMDDKRGFSALMTEAVEVALRRDAELSAG